MLLFFSLTAIYAVPPPPPAPPTVGQGQNLSAQEEQLNTSEENETTDEISVSKQQATENTAGDEQLQCPTPAPKSNKLVVFLIITNVTLLLCFGYIFYDKKTKKDSEKYKRLKDYIKNNLSGGYEWSALKQHLLNNGWKEKDLDKAFNEISMEEKNI